jgi:tol-pal system protein YbgF
MNPFGPAARWGKLFAILSGIVVVFSLALVGCGSAEEAQQDEFGDLPQVTPAAQLEYRVDSLINETRKLHDMLDQATAENRGLTAKVAELETKIAEAAAQPPAPAISPAAPMPAPVIGGSADVAGYEAAMAQMKSKNYQGAIEQFQALLSSGAAGNLADNCQYWIGESYYAMKSYPEALQAFRATMEYKRSEKLSYAQLMIGNCEALLGNKDGAREAYNAVVTNFPMSPVVEKARTKLDKMK